ncbi:hypothetical protein VCSRO122_2468 [Vibrio cholerae]|nr:hypothetical protein VCSRO109_2204 [Vibrio cholerae]GHZ07716.1 hypothetical protein VCSRO122_2468 [Vibrio cholerae]GHZ40496.1 hypothetical protein VCSRO3_2704 [Vibrio cholerae]
MPISAGHKSQRCSIAGGWDLVADLNFNTIEE